MPIHQERRRRVELVETAFRETTEIRPQDRLEFARRKLADHGSFLLAPEPRLNALDDLLIGLGENRIGEVGVGVALDVAEHP